MLGEDLSFQTQNFTYMILCVDLLFYVHKNGNKCRIIFFLFGPQPLVDSFFKKKTVFRIFRSVKFMQSFHKHIIHIKKTS